MNSSKKIIGYDTNFCKKCGANIDNRQFFICNCFLPRKKFSYLLIDSQLYNSLFVDVHCNDLVDVSKEDFKNIHSVLEILCFMIRHKSGLDKNIVSQYVPLNRYSNIKSLLKFTNNENDKSSLNLNNVQIYKIYQSYFKLLYDFEYTNKLNNLLLQKIKSLEEKHNSPKKSCRSCLKYEENLEKVKEEYNNILKNFSNAQSEKEKIVMKYVKTEKRVLEIQKNVDLANKQRDDVCKENTYLQKKLKKVQDDLKKFVSDNKQKQTEIIHLKNQIEQLKEVDNIKDIKLKGIQNRLNFISDGQKETQNKVVESSEIITKLKNECEVLRSNIHCIKKTLVGVDEISHLVTDQNFEKKQLIVSSDHNTNEKLKILEEKQSISEKENSLLLSQLQLLQNECSDLKSRFNALNSLYEKEKDDKKMMDHQLKEAKSSCKLLENKVNELTQLEIEFQLLKKEKSELLLDIDTYQNREKQMLNFTEQVTDKHVQLQSKFSDMETKFLILENNQDPLRKNINKLTNKIKTLEHSLGSEKLKHYQECELLTKCLADQIYYGQKLAQQLEETEGENFILRKKKELIVREMTREF